MDVAESRLKVGKTMCSWMRIRNVCIQDLDWRVVFEAAPPSRFSLVTVVENCLELGRTHGFWVRYGALTTGRGHDKTVRV